MVTQKKHTVFIVDDDRDTIAQFRDFFADLPYLVYYWATPEEALAIIETVAPDIVLNRFHAAEQNKKNVLKTFQEKSPNSIRIIYSDEDDMNELMKLVASGLAQRMLCLPWEKHRVAETLSRDLITRSRIRARKCWEFLKKENLLTPLPKVVKEIETLLEDPDYNLQDIVRFVEQDPNIVSRILKVVNSPAFIKRASISNLTHAISFLGVRQLREILHFICSIQHLPIIRPCQSAAVNVANQSFFCSRVAAEIAQDLAPHSKTEAATAALLHDIGKLLIFSVACDRFLDYVKGGDISDLSIEIEEKLFDLNHAELGSCLLIWWNLPMSIVEAAANHHYPLHELWTIPKCVAIADRLVAEFLGNTLVTQELDSLDESYNIAHWRDRVKDIAKDLENIY